MRSRLRSRLTYANVVASIALFIALGGTSYGLATGSIGSREIKNNAVRGKDIRNGTIGSRDVKDGDLLAEDFKAGQLPAGERGLQGPPGPQGDKGERGLPGPTQFARVTAAGVLINGTAVSASRSGTGNYSVTFPSAVDRCAGAANSASFPGFDSSVFRIWAQLSMGFGDPKVVSVRLFDSSSASSDSSFGLVLACP